ncbi:methyl-accepting chemotaxis protein [Anaerotaenia torta]|uniref:methyl-accepting chemotaxis protein n=1 Tax=Anaerotaenia torta TaxID=433293 RepID=UPI003D215355
MEKQNAYNLKRVDRINVLVTISIVLLICSQVVMNRGLAESIAPLAAGAFVVAVAVINYFLKINQNIKALIYALLPAIVVLALFILDIFTMNKHYMLIITTAMITLYFRKNLILIYAVIVDIGMVVIYIITPKGLMGTEHELSGFLKVFTLMVGLHVLLYFLTKWGNDLIQVAEDQGAQAQKLLQKLETTLKMVEEGTNTLDHNIGEVDTQLEGIHSASKGILDSVQQMAMAIQEEATSVYRINETMSHSLEVVNQTIDISRGVVEKSNRMSVMVEDGWIKMNEVTDRMDTVNSAIENTVTTVSDLEISLEQINQLLVSIKTIAEQTNLLALNASIESARAGEQGKGFAVVADSIRTLSQQSRKIVEDINEVTAMIFEKSQAASRMSEKGKAAAHEGIRIISEVSAYLADILASYQETNTDLSKSMNEIAVAANNFISVQEQVTNVASISEENAASTQEILSIIEDENTKIDYINASVSEVHGLSRKLKEIVEEV